MGRAVPLKDSKTEENSSKMTAPPPIPEPIHGTRLISPREEYDFNPYVYLTDASFASLTGDSAFFVENGELSTDPTKQLFADVSTGKYDNSGETFQYGNPRVYGFEKAWTPTEADVEGEVDFTKIQPTSLTSLKSGQTGPQRTLGSVGNSLYCQAGVWDIIDPETGEVIYKNAPKFIAIRDSYQSPSGEHKKRYIDYGFFTIESKYQTAEAFNFLLTKDGWKTVFSHRSRNKKTHWEEKYPGTSFDLFTSYYDNTHLGWDAGLYYPNCHASIRDKKYWPISTGNEVGNLGDWNKWTGANPKDEVWAPKDMRGWLKDVMNPLVPDGKFLEHHNGFMFGGLISHKKVDIELEDPQSAASRALLETLNAYTYFIKMMSEEDLISYKKLIDCFFIKEITSIVLITHKEYAEKYYPAVDTAFDNTVSKTIETLLAAIATANGDYTYTSPGNSGGGQNFDIDLGGIATTLMKMFFGAMANSVDPTWKTKWFLPGPFTPFGVVAKLLDGKGNIFDGSPNAKKPKFNMQGLNSCEDKIDMYTNPVPIELVKQIKGLDPKDILPIINALGGGGQDDPDQKD